MSSLFVECIVAPKFSDGAVEILGRKKNLRVLEGRAAWGSDGGTTNLDYKRVRGGVLVQERAPVVIDDAEWSVVTERAPTDEEYARPAVRVARGRVRQVERDRARARRRDDRHRRRPDVARRRGVPRGAQGGDGGPRDRRARCSARTPSSRSATASTRRRTPGSRAIVQPGGSVRDAEVIAAANERGIAMVFTGKRQFRH